MPPQGGITSRRLTTPWFNFAAGRGTILSQANSRSPSNAKEINGLAGRGEYGAGEQAARLERLFPHALPQGGQGGTGL